MSENTADRFFAAFATSPEAVVALFADDAETIAVRDAGDPQQPLWGTRRGRAGVLDFLATLAAAFDTEAFSVDRTGEADGVAWAFGSFRHRVRATGRIFASDWALRLDVVDGLIRRYRFYEDSAALVAASRA